MRKMNIQTGTADIYREEPVKPAIYTMLIVVTIVAAPLGWLNQKIGAEGFKVADTSRYQDLVRGVDRDVQMVNRMLVNETLDEKIIQNTISPGVKLITPDIMPTNMGEAAAQDTTYEIKLSGIYWSRSDPIVTIDGENYHVGDNVKNHRIVEIRQTEVVFEDPMGEKVVVYFYDYLRSP